MSEMVLRRINHVNEERRRRRQIKQKEKVHLRHQLRNNWSNNARSPRKSTTLPWTDYSRMSKGLYVRKWNGALTRFKVFRIIVITVRRTLLAMLLLSPYLRLCGIFCLCLLSSASDGIMWSVNSVPIFRGHCISRHSQCSLVYDAG